MRFFRDGGDNRGVSLAARKLAPEYGVEYLSPAFAMHKKGHYGAIVGRGYADADEYARLLEEAGKAGCDFIKIMVSGIISFRSYGELSCESLSGQEMAFLAARAHEAGFSVMAHVNGAQAVREAAEAGIDSIEHGYFADAAALEAMAEHGSIWVPTLAAVAAFVGREGFDSAVAEETLRRQMDAVSLGYKMGVKIAPGSDSGAVGVVHGRGTVWEYELLKEALGPGSEEELNVRAAELFRRFRPGT